jgi:hypothetical protein
MTVAGFPDYLISATNVAHNLRVITLAGQDELTINGNTGPTLVDTGAHDDVITVNASKLTQPLTPPANSMVICRSCGASWSSPVTCTNRPWLSSSIAVQLVETAT